ncbi:amidase signature domain-containing protein [Coniochaeta sp. 2T2.1]|nr:amidase signature domain-containing protein [Coniochaeta sp. 2T2.1]
MEECGRSICVGEVPYLIHPECLGTVEDYDGPEDAVTPVIVLDEIDVQPPHEHLTAKIEKLIDDDDVCSTDFIGHIVVKPRLDLKGTTQKENRNENAVSTLSLLSHINGEECRIEHRVTLLQETSHDPKLASGPYFLHGRNLHAAFRLYPDDQDAFICGMIPTRIRSPSLSFLQTSLFVKPSSTPIKYIPVPSRHLYASAEPLRGTRMALNDNYQLEDITTTRSSSAFVEYHDAGNRCPEEDEKCELLLKLVKLRAAFVGKTKTTFFSSGSQWVDFPSPIDPRGDSYQEALGSSAGAAAALAGYGWLDFAIGGDFSANGRDSVACHGLLGVRLSQSKGNPQGVTCNRWGMDSELFLSRSITSLASTTNSVVHHPTSGGKPQHALLWPTDFMTGLAAAHWHLITDFAAQLESFLDIEKTEFDFGERWAQSHKDRGLKSFIAQTPYLLTIWAEWNTHKTFVTDYSEEFERRPFIEQPTRSR